MKNNVAFCDTDRSSSSTNPGSYFGGERGFPKKCMCGSELAIHTSQSKNNPGRPYFRCARTREDGHFFKWVEDGTHEEVKDLLLKFQRREAQIDNGIIEIHDLKIEVNNLKEEVTICKTKLHHSKVMNLIIFVCIIMLVLGIVVVYFGLVV